MGKTLIIAEKPSVAADIAKVVGAAKKTETAWTGGDHVVSWAVGHLLEFVQPQVYDEKFVRWRLKDLPILPEEFKTEPVRGHKRQLNALKKFLTSKDVDRVVNACDAGREGELIFQEIYRWSGSDKPVDRLWLQSMTAASIAASLASPRPGSSVSGLADAADCRAESDWLIGYNATRALTIRLRSARDKNVWSAGRVQTATLALLVERERAILKHVPEPYWLVDANFQTTGDGVHEYLGHWFDPQQDGARDRIYDQATLDRVVAALAEKAAGLVNQSVDLAQQQAVVEAAQSGGEPFLNLFTIFVLACFIGFYVVWSVTPALHSPLMAVTNAISSVIIVGGLLAAGPAQMDFSAIMGFFAVTLASVNIFGGFIVTHRMLAMFKKKR